MTPTSSPDSPAAQVLLVDDNVNLRRVIARVLSNNGYVVTEVGDGRDALWTLTNQTFDVVLSDVMMPQMSGLELLRAIRRTDLELPVILMTAMPSVEGAKEAKRLGAMYYLTKPVEGSRLLATVARAEQLGKLAQAKRQALEGLGSPHGLAGDRVGLEVTLDRALESLFMAFQPIVRATDRALYGYEALMRTGEAALPHPGAILDAAERLGRLPDVGQRVRSVSAASFAPKSEGFLFVNLHASDLGDADLFSATAPLTQMASRVVLEITERESLEGIESVERKVAELRELGFRIAIDDLGAGYAGLTSFVSLQPEVVKLDMSLVRDVDKVALKQKLARSLVSVCRDMGVLIVAEGIETVAERDCVVDLGCELLQGYLFARPGPVFPTFVWE